jgi:hypothetical protein
MGELDVPTAENADPTQIVTGSSLPENYRIARSENSGSSVGLGDSAIVIKSGDTMMTVTPRQITTQGKKVELSLPNTNNIIVEESGFLRFLPKCFIPPFSLPDHLPNVSMLTAAVRVAKAIGTAVKNSR